MSLLKAVLAIGALVIGAILGFSYLHQTHPQALFATPLPKGTLSGDLASSATLAAAPASAPSGVIALSNDPRRNAAPVAFVADAIDPERAKRYNEALEDIEVDACNSNGTFFVRLRNDKQARLMHNGQSIVLPNGLNLSLKLHGYPACKVTVSDGKIAIGEVAGF